MKTDLERIIPFLMRFLPFFDRFFPIFLKVFLLFDWFFMFFFSYFLERTLRTWKIHGLIDDYGTRVVKTTKLHYKIDICIVLTMGQAKIVLNELITKILKRI